MSDHEEQFENAISGESLTYPLQCSALRKNGHVMIKGNPCKIVEMTTSKTGKHGHAKASGCFTEIWTLIFSVNLFWTVNKSGQFHDFIIKILLLLVVPILRILKNVLCDNIIAAFYDGKIIHPCPSSLTLYSKI